MLLRREVFKAFSKNIIFGFICLMTLVIFAYGVLVTKHEPKGVESHWRNSYTNLADYYYKLAESPSFSEKERVTLINEATVYRYMVEHDVAPLDNHSASHFVLETTNLSILISICVILISCYLITYEYSNHTMMRLVMMGKKRWKVLCSKIVAILTCAVIYSLVFEILCLLIGWGLFGFDSLAGKIVYFNGSCIVERTIIEQVGLNVLYSFISLTAISCLAVLIAIITQSNLVGMTICFGIIMVGTFCFDYLYTYDWLKYTLFANTDFSRFLRNEMLFNNYSPMMALCVLFLHIVLFMFFSFLVFIKRDITK